MWAVSRTLEPTQSKPFESIPIYMALISCGPAGRRKTDPDSGGLGEVVHSLVLEAAVDPVLGRLGALHRQPGDLVVERSTSASETRP